MRRLCVGMLFLCVAVSQANAQAPCIDPTQSWAWSYPQDKISQIIYYLDTEIFAVFYATGVSHMANEVPISVAQQFQTLGYGVSPDAKWNGICRSFNQILESQDHCPLLSQVTKYLLSKPSC